MTSSVSFVERQVLNMKYKVENLMSANIVITSNCNSKCASCNYWKMPPIYLDIQKIYDFYDMINKYECSSVVITGGEPTLHPAFKDIVKTAKEKYGFIVILSTNGSLIKYKFDEVKDYIDSYCISFDGYNKEQYKVIRGIDNYNEILGNIELIKDYNENIQVWLSCLIQKKNFVNLNDIYLTALNSGADGIFFNVPELRGMCFGRDREKGNYDCLMLDTEQCNELRNIIDHMISMDEKVGFLCQNSQSLHKFVDYFSFFNEGVKPEPRKCYVPYNTITLNEKGKIRPCFYLEDEMRMTGDDINSDFMTGIRRKLDQNEEYRLNCDYCCQFNS